MPLTTACQFLKTHLTTAFKLKTKDLKTAFEFKKCVCYPVCPAQKAFEKHLKTPVNKAYVKKNLKRNFKQHKETKTLKKTK